MGWLGGGFHWVSTGLPWWFCGLAGQSRRLRRGRRCRVSAGTDKWQAKIAEARQRGHDIVRVMQERGKGPDMPNGRGFKRCPFCEHKGSAAIFASKDGTLLFQCKYTACLTSCKALDEIGFIAMDANMSRKEAFSVYLKEAGVWTDAEPYAPSIMPGQKARKFKEQPVEEETGRRVAEVTTVTEVAGVTDGAGETAEMAEGKGQMAEGEAEGNEECRMKNEEDGAETAEEMAEGKGQMADGQSAMAEGEPPAEVADAEADGEAAGNEECRMQNEEDGAEAVEAMADGKMADGKMEAEEEPAKLGDGEAEQKKPETVAPGLTALRWFYGQLSLSDEDVRKIWMKRGLTTFTCHAMGLRSNPESNMALLEQLPGLFGMKEALDSGLWMEADRKEKKPRRPNRQFAGLGQGRKKEAHERRGKDDKFHWEMNCPVLIPYFNADGELMKLRPHKGGASGDTAAGAPLVYVPREQKMADGKMADGKGLRMEWFPKVVVCEGEFKAMAVWQTLVSTQAGQKATEFGVCSFPGISFGKSVETRYDLEQFLQGCHAKSVVVAFDDEDKSGAPKEKRYPAQIWARYLAEDLHRKMGLTTLVCTLPKAWRDEKGKADWDGALARMVHGK